MVLRKKSISTDHGISDWGFRVCLWKEDSVAGESLVEDTEEVSSTEEIKILRKRLQYNGKRATIFR